MTTTYQDLLDEKTAADKAFQDAQNAHYHAINKAIQAKAVWAHAPKGEKRLAEQVFREAEAAVVRAASASSDELDRKDEAAERLNAYVDERAVIDSAESDALGNAFVRVSQEAAFALVQYIISRRGAIRRFDGFYTASEKVDSDHIIMCGAGSSTSFKVIMDSFCGGVFVENVPCACGQVERGVVGIPTEDAPKMNVYAYPMD